MSRFHLTKSMLSLFQLFLSNKLRLNQSNHITWGPKLRMFDYVFYAMKFDLFI